MTNANGTGIKIAKDIFWIGGDDRTADVFEGEIPIPEGVSYNTYLISDDKTCLLDTCDSSIATKFWINFRQAIGDRNLDYLVINHMEPDHGAGIIRILETYPDVTVVGNNKTFDMLFNFYGIIPKKKLEVKDGDTLRLGRHVLRFVFAVMVHWPEVMFSYDESENILFSADAFGTFKALSGTLYADDTDFNKDYLSEARRYYSNIVGKYGSKVQSVFGKLAGLPIDMICPLHGPIWRNDLGYILGKYDLWSRYEPEESGVVIAYASMYGNTTAVVDSLAMMLKDRGVKKVSVYDVSRTHSSYVVSDVFKYSNIVLAAPTYNNSLHPAMTAVLNNMEVMAVQNRKFSVIGNGSWAPQSPRIMEDRLIGMKDMQKIGETFVIKSSMKPEQASDLEKLADDIAMSLD